VRTRTLHFILAGAAFLVTVFTTSGCVYSRLLDLKNQIKSFQTMFTVSGDSDLRIHAHKPVLKISDTRFLMGSPPLQVIPHEDGSLDHYEFKLKGVSTETLAAPLYSLTLDVLWKNNMVEGVFIPESFLLLFPRDVTLRTIKSFGSADIQKIKRTFTSHVEVDTALRQKLPSTEKMLEFLGPPLEVTAVGQEHTKYYYRYNIVGDKNDVPLMIWLTYNADETLAAVKIFWDTSTALIYYDEPIQ
jgi:hypothetical protein